MAVTMSNETGNQSFEQNRNYEDDYTNTGDNSNDLISGGGGSGGYTVASHYSLRGNVMITISEALHESGSEGPYPPFNRAVSQQDSRYSKIKFTVTVEGLNYYNNETIVTPSSMGKSEYTDGPRFEEYQNTIDGIDTTLTYDFNFIYKSGAQLLVDTSKVKIQWDELGEIRLVLGSARQICSGTIDFLNSNISSTNINNVVVEFRITGGINGNTVYVSDKSEDFNIEGTNSGGSDLIVSETYGIRGISAGVINYKSTNLYKPEIYLVNSPNTICDTQYSILVKKIEKTVKPDLYYIYTQEEVDKLIKITKNGYTDKVNIGDTIPNRTEIRIENLNGSSESKLICLTFVTSGTNQSKVFNIYPITLKGDDGSTEPKECEFTCSGYTIQNGSGKGVNFRIENADREITGVNVPTNIQGVQVSKQISNNVVTGTITNISTNPSITAVTITFTVVFKDGVESLSKQFTLLPPLSSGEKQLVVRIGAKVEKQDELGLNEETSTCSVFILNYHE